jgi:hypothetical protein
MRVGNKLRGNPLRWHSSPGEDKRGIGRLIPSKSSLENPKGRGILRPKGENASHERSRAVAESFGGQVNHESGRLETVTYSSLPAD